MSYNNKGNVMTNKIYDTDFFKKSGQQGGNSTKKRYGKEYYKNLGKKSAEKRWGKKK